MECHAIILAGGRGTRMNMDVPKCAVKLCGKPMAQYIVDSCLACGIDDITVVVGYQKEVMMGCLKGKLKFAIQTEQKGTGHATQCAEAFLGNSGGVTLIFPGDMPFVDCETIKELLKAHKKSKNTLTVVTMVCEEPGSYGRIYRENGCIKKIVEYKDANVMQRKIKEVNSGLFCVDTKALFAALGKLNNHNKQGEYYLTDIVEIIGATNRVDSYIIKDEYILIGINDIATLNKAEEIYIKTKNA